MRGRRALGRWVAPFLALAVAGCDGDPTGGGRLASGTYVLVAREPGIEPPIVQEQRWEGTELHRTLRVQSTITVAGERATLAAEDILTVWATDGDLRTLDVEQVPAIHDLVVSIRGDSIDLESGPLGFRGAVRGDSLLLRDRESGLVHTFVRSGARSIPPGRYRCAEPEPRVSDIRKMLVDHRSSGVRWWGCAEFERELGTLEVEERGMRIGPWEGPYAFDTGLLGWEVVAASDGAEGLVIRGFLDGDGGLRVTWVEGASGPWAYGSLRFALP